MRRITWLGHATVLIEAGGARLLTDPLLRERVMHLSRRVPAAADPGRLDAVLVSHVHRDHLDKPSLRMVDAPVAVVPRGARKFVADLGFADVREVEVDDTVEIAGTAVRVVPAWHDGHRRPGPGAAEFDTLGYLVDGIWFAGDTDLDDGLAELRGSVEVALVPIWGWGPTLGPGHMDPDAAARAVALIEPRIAVPIHWGTYYPIVSREQGQLTEPPKRFAAQVAELASATRVETLSVGGTLSL
jgi:L-ascorbate metabolism protein UlaG (beta-lactamase superfamily)